MNKIPIELKIKIIEYLPLSVQVKLYKLFNIIIPQTLYMKLLMIELNNFHFCYTCGEQISLKYIERFVGDECEQCTFGFFN